MAGAHTWRMCFGVSIGTGCLFAVKGLSPNFCTYENRVNFERKVDVAVKRRKIFAGDFNVSVNDAQHADCKHDCRKRRKGTCWGMPLAFSWDVGATKARTVDAECHAYS